MLARLRRAALPTLAALAAAAAGPARAGEVNGYVSSRSQYTRTRVDGLLAADDLPRLSELLEVNAQVRQAYLERAFVYGDVSLFGQFAWDYRGVDREGNEVKLGERDVAATRPLVSVNELYVSHEFVPELTVLLGKKRVVWGSGMAFNPTDLLNPAKDPTDPSLQRAGAWMALVEVPLERVTFSVLGSPKVTAQASGIPYRFLSWPAWDERDAESHWLLAGRVYALVANADLSLMAFYGNRHPDGFEDKLRAGLSASRYFADVNELHVEALVQTGSPRSRVDPACVADRAAALNCLLSRTPFLRADRLESDELLPRVLVGGRRHFDDESLLSLEYLFQADGLRPGEVQDLVNALAIARDARALGFEPAPPLGQTEDDPGIPTRFRFEPLGRHYLFATYQKPKIRDDFTLAVTALASLQDLSGVVAPSLAWSATEWLTLTASAFVPFPGPAALAATDPVTDEKVGEYGLAPMAWRGLFEARAFY